MPDIALDDLERVGPGGIGMRKVVGPHNVVLAPPFQVVSTDRVVEEAGIDLVVDKLAWVLRDRWRVLLAEAIVIVIPLLNDPGQPAAFVFDRDNFKLWIPLQNAVKDQLEETIGDIHEL